MDGTRWALWECSLIPDGPKHFPSALHNIHQGTAEEFDFIDRMNRYVCQPTYNEESLDKKGRRVLTPTPACSLWQAKAVWDFANGWLLLDEQGEHLYRRRVDTTGRMAELGWERVESLADTYHAGKGEANPMWDEQIKTEAAKMSVYGTQDGPLLRVHRGVKFADRIYARDPQTGHVTLIREGQPGWKDANEQAWILTVPCAYDEGLACRAADMLASLTADEASAENLTRMWATPMLEKWKHLTYVLHGRGGDGKSLLLGSLSDSFPDCVAQVDAATLAGGRGFEKQQEAHRLIGRLWAYDDDADSIGLADMTTLKKVSTGGAITARLIGRDAVSFSPSATLVIATNNDFLTDGSQASLRRYAFVRMRGPARSGGFGDVVEFRREHGCLGFLMASCDLWLVRGDEPRHDVSLADPLRLTDEEQALVDAVCAGGGKAAAARLLAAVSPKRSVQEETLARLGLARIGVVWDKSLGKAVRCVGVADETRFAPYREAWQEAQDMAEAAEAEEEARRQPVPMPDGSDVPAPDATPDSYGFACDYVPARPDKVAVGWKTLVESPNADTSKRPESRVYAVVPAPGYCVLDLDTGKDGGEDGWTVLQREVGSYGGERLPRTYLVGTPSGGAHLYYRIPGPLLGHLKDAVHAQGIPVDMRAERKGYVIGAGSVTDAGRYTLLDVPPDGEAVPDLTPQLCQWLTKHGYTDTPPAANGTGIAGMQAFKTATRSTAGAGKGGAWRADMSPIPVGQRNSTLYGWAFGRLRNHPDNARQIEADLRERGRASGLPDSEVETIWRSVVRGVSEAGV